MSELKGVKSTYRNARRPRPTNNGLQGCLPLLVAIAGFVLSAVWLFSGDGPGNGSGRKGRCFRMRRNLAHVVEVRIQRQPSWLSGDQGTKVVHGREASAEVKQRQPLRRKHLRTLLDAGVIRGVPVCASQGPLRTPDSYHYVAYVRDDGLVSLRCRVHNW